MISLYSCHIRAFCCWAFPKLQTALLNYDPVPVKNDWGNKLGAKLLEHNMVRIKCVGPEFDSNPIQFRNYWRRLWTGIFGQMLAVPLTCESTSRDSVVTLLRRRRCIYGPSGRFSNLSSFISSLSYSDFVFPLKWGHDTEATINLPFRPNKSPTKASDIMSLYGYMQANGQYLI